MEVPPRAAARVSRKWSDLGGFRQGKGILGVNAQVPYRALQLRMAEQDLHSSQIAGPLVEEGDFGPT